MTSSDHITAHKANSVIIQPAFAYSAIENVNENVNDHVI